MKLILGDLQIPLFPTYDDPNAAMNHTKISCKEILDLLSATYHLDELNANNWKTYKSLMYSYLRNENKPEWYDTSDERFMNLLLFFSTYENNNINNELVTVVANTDSLQNLYSNQNFMGRLPYYATIKLDENHNTDESQTTINGNISIQTHNISKATSYATKHATNRNGAYPSFGADCTNFVSQIAHAAGKSMSDKWYIKKETNLGQLGHTLIHGQ